MCKNPAKTLRNSLHLLYNSNSKIQIVLIFIIVNLKLKNTLTYARLKQTVISYHTKCLMKGITNLVSIRSYGII